MSAQRVSHARTVVAVAAALLVVAGGGFEWGRHAQAARLNASTPVAVATGTSALPVSAIGVTAPDYSPLVQRFGPAVVNISTSGMRKVARDDSATAGPDPSDPLYQLFKRFMAPGQGNNGAEPRVMRGEGSGFIVSADGVIVTNAHVVKDASSVTVKLTDRREFQAKVLGSDPSTDVAVLKIAAKDLPVVQIGSAHDLAVGQSVVAIGSPYGFENTVTSGIVSAKQRALPDESYVSFIQTDVPINPGNSGGPLFNTQGQVVGINSQIYSGTGGYQGLSFAIPIDLAMQIKDQIVAHGHATHARLGATVQEVNQTLAQSFRLAKPEGALVSSVQPGSPAERAGLKAGDVVLAANGHAIVDTGDLPALVGEAKPGSVMTLKVWRDGAPKELRATLANAADATADAGQAKDAKAQDTKLGLALRPLQPPEQQASGVHGGLMIEAVSGPSELAGIQPGDVLVAVDGHAVANVAEVRQALAQQPRSAALLIQRDGDRIFVPVPLS